MTRAAFFDAARKFAPKGKLPRASIALLDQVADMFGIERDAGGAWLLFALDLIKQFEGCELRAYPDPASGGDPWTVGWGATGAGIKRGILWTQEQADARLAEDVMRFGRGVDALLGEAPTTARQKAALVSLAYNVGLANLSSSTLLKMHRGGDHAGAAKQFARWNRASGKVLAGLTRRRAAEARMYEGTDA